MPSKRETVLQALYAKLQPQLLGTVRRNDGTSALIPGAGTGALVTIFDGSTAGTELLSPLCYEIEHEVPVTIEAMSRADVDNAGQAIAGLVQGDQTMGGLVDWLKVDSFDVDAEEPEGERQVPMPPTFTGTLSVVLFYTAPSVGG